MTIRTACTVTCCGIFVAMAASGVPEVLAQGRSINQRPTVARALIAGSPRLRDGDFKTTGTSGVCGEIPKEASLTGTAVFSIEYFEPGANDTLLSISFGSKELVGRVTESKVFLLNVGVKTADGGRPPNYVLHTDGSIPMSTGTATLTRGPNGAVTLHVVGSERDRETIDLTVTCT